MKNVDLVKIYVLSLLSFLPNFVALILSFPRLNFSGFVLFLSYSAGVFTVYAVLYRFHRAIFYVLLTLFLFFAFSFSGYHFLTGRTISYNVLASIYETNSTEVIEFVVSKFFLKLSVFSITAYLFTLLFFRSSIFLTPKFLEFMGDKKGATIVLLLSVLGCYFVSLSYDLREFYPVRVVARNYKYFVETYAVANQYMGQTYSFLGDQEKTSKSNFILVLGEASRKESMSVYGGEADTNPELEKLKAVYPENVLFFSNAVSASTFTRISVPSLLSTASAKEYLKLAEYPSIIRVLEGADFNTVVLSNQEKRGRHSDLITTLFKESDAVQFLKKHNGGFDENLVPELDHYLEKEDAGSQFILVHMSGSHYHYQSRYPKSWSYFFPESVENYYMNSIRYTDFVLSEFITRMMEQPEPYVMLFVPDHGEYVNDFGDGLYGHGMRKMTRFETEIPFILVFNQPFSVLHQEQVERLRQRTERLISHDNVSHLILGLLRAEDQKYYKPDFDISSESFSEVERYFIDEDLNIYHYSEVEFSAAKH